jgi:hypothetical protein
VQHGLDDSLADLLTLFPQAVETPVTQPMGGAPPRVD